MIARRADFPMEVAEEPVSVRDLCCGKALLMMGGRTKFLWGIEILSKRSSVVRSSLAQTPRLD